jgi:glycosyltransferase involved in cell wall biosynthesis
MTDISIVISTMNEEKYIEKTLRNLQHAVAETQPIKTEIIVIDASSDKTLEIAKKYVQDKAVFLPAKGLSSAKNRGIQLASGRIVIFMDADTVIQKGTIVEVYNKFQDSCVVATIPQILPLNYVRLPFASKLFYLLNLTFFKGSSTFNFLLRLYNGGDFLAVRKDIFHLIEPFNETFCILENTDLLTRASRYGEIKVLSTVVFESGRKALEWGLVKSYWVWLRNFVSLKLTRHLYDQKYETIR